MADNTQKFNVEIDFVSKNKELFDSANKQAKETVAAAKSIKNAYAENYEGLKKLNPELVKQIDLEKQQAAEIKNNKEAAKALAIEEKTRIKEQTQLQKQQVQEQKEAAKALAEIEKQQIKSIRDKEKADEQYAKSAVRNNQLVIREIHAQAKEIHASVALLKDTASDIDRFAKPLFTGGLAVVGGFFAAANKYVNNAKEATETTIAWKKATDSVNQSSGRIGEILTQTALPVLKESAEVVEKIAGFLEAHPEVAGATLKAGLLALTLGTLGKVAASGIRLYADLKMDAALTLQFRAAELQLAAAEAQLKAAGIQSATGSKAPGAGLSPTALGGILAGGTAFGAIGLGASNIGAKLFGTTPVQFWKDMLDEEKKAISIWAFDFGKLFGKGSEFFQGATSALGLTNKSAGGASTPLPLGGSEETQAALLSAYEQYKSEDLALVNSHYAERQSITDNALAQTQAANKTLASSIASAVIEATKQITAATDSFNQADKRAEEDYLANRLKIAADGGDEILQIEQDSQERLKKLRETFEERSQVAARSRDALALVDARKDYNKGRAEEISNTNKEIARRRADIAKRLQELDVQFAKEHDRRVEDFNARIEEIKAQEIENTVQAAAAHAAEIDRIKKEEEEKLKVEDAAFKKERLAKYNGFIAQIDDLNKYLTGDITSREAAHAQNLADLDAFLAAERAKRQAFYAEGTTAAVPVHDFTGYTPKGIYAMAQDGQTQFTLSGSSTKTMEKIVGGQLTQQNVLGAAGGRGSIVLQYSPRFDGSYTEDIKRENRKDTMRIFNQIVAGMAT